MKIITIFSFLLFRNLPPPTFCKV